MSVVMVLVWTVCEAGCCDCVVGIYMVVCVIVCLRETGLKCVGVGEAAYSSCMVCLLSVTGAPNYMVINPCF